MKAQTKALVASVVVIALALTAVSGVTYSWFSDSEQTDIDVSTAVVKYTSTFEGKKELGEGAITKNVADNTFSISNLAAAQNYTINVSTVNESTVQTVYRMYVTHQNGELTDYDLKNILVNDISIFGNEEIVIEDWTSLKAGVNPNDYTIAITTPESYGDIGDAPLDWNNESSRAGLKISVIIEAYQASYKESAVVGGVSYNSLGEAVSNAHDGDTIKLMANARESIRILGKDITIDLNGKNIVAPKPDDKAIIVGAGAKLTINGSGVVDGGHGGDNVSVSAEGGTVIINGGSFTVGHNAGGYGNSVIYSAGGNVTVNGGSFYTDYNYRGTYYVLNQNNGNPGTIAVNGGSFDNYDPSTGDDNLSGNFVSEGYTVVSQSKGEHIWYTVVKGSGSSPGTQDELNNGISASTEKDVGLVLPSNTNFTLDNDIANGETKARNVSFIGDGTQTVDVVTNAITAEGGKLNYQRGSNFAFKNLTIQAGEGDFDGVVCDGLTYINCTIKGKLTLYGKATFINCTFENTMANQYSIWTWGGTDVKFENCTFNTNGKAILLYGQATALNPTNLVVKNCIFNDRNNGTAEKAAIEIGNDYNATYTLTIENATVNGFAKGKNTDSTLWANKNSMVAAHLSVTIDGTKAQ